METRDIVNAPEVKKTIVERSQRRKDDPEITQWFEKKFFELLCDIIDHLIELP